MADSPKEAEASQALFCYIADVLGISKIKEWDNYINGKLLFEDFSDKYSNIMQNAIGKFVQTTISLQQIKSFLKKDKTWFLSSLLIAKKILLNIQDINSKFSKIKAPQWSQLFYAHGDKDVMYNISLLFKTCNENYRKQKGSIYFGDLNKWCPADIYFASDDAKSKIKNLLKDQNLSFAQLNEFVSKSIQSGDLLPLSLKKTTSDVKLLKINFVENKSDVELNTLKIVNVGGSNVTKRYEEKKGVSYNRFTGKLIYTNETGQRDIYIHFKSQISTGWLQIRHIAYTSVGQLRPHKEVKIDIKYTGAEARGGSIASFPILCSIIKTVDNNFGTKMINLFNNSFKNFEVIAAEYIKKTGLKLYNGNPEQKSKFQKDVGNLSAIYFMNVISKELNNYFTSSSKNKKEDILRAVFAYISSKTPLSGKFVIAK
jgi:hypothetical protein